MALNTIAEPIEVNQPSNIELNVTREEVVIAMKKMKRCKAPGIDQITLEIFHAVGYRMVGIC